MTHEPRALIERRALVGQRIELIVDAELFAECSRGHHLPAVRFGRRVIGQPPDDLARHLRGRRGVPGVDQHLVHARGPHRLGQRETRGDAESPNALTEELDVADVGDAVEGGDTEEIRGADDGTENINDAGLKQ